METLIWNIIFSIFRFFSKFDLIYRVFSILFNTFFGNIYFFVRACYELRVTNPGRKFNKLERRLGFSSVHRIQKSSRWASFVPTIWVFPSICWCTEGTADPVLTSVTNRILARPHQEQLLSQEGRDVWRRSSPEAIDSFFRNADRYGTRKKEEQRKYTPKKNTKRTDVYGHKKKKESDRSLIPVTESFLKLSVTECDSRGCSFKRSPWFYQYFQRNHIIYLDETLSEQERTLVLARTWALFTS